MEFRFRETKLKSFSVCEGSVGSWSLCDGDPFSGSWRFSRTTWWFTSWRSAGVGQPDPTGPGHSGPGCGGSEVCPTWHSPPGHPQAFGGKSRLLLSPDLIDLDVVLGLDQTFFVVGPNPLFLDPVLLVLGLDVHFFWL